MKVAEIVKEQVVAGLEKGVVPWHRPWRMAECQNFASGRRYTGINPWLLQIECWLRGWDKPVFATYNQITGMGGTVRKGEHGAMVVFTQQQMVDREVVKDGMTVTEAKEGFRLSPPKQRATYMLRYYKVFNIAQTDGLDGKVKHLGPASHKHDTSAEVDDIISATGAHIQHGGNRACYSPMLDTINMPPKVDFETMESYYGTMFHELVHWTGHSTRLARITEAAGFGDTDYSKEELVAEVGACMLSVEVGIAPEVTDNNQAYINTWLSRIKDADARYVVQAASQADKAADYIVGLRNAVS